MLVGNSFDLWQKDSFFSAAEEVQQSADLMESAYRAWLREKRAGVTPEFLGELCRDLQRALNTAKWQLDEFERAIDMSYTNGDDDITKTRHGEFISAIGDQISHVEGDLKESLNVDREGPLQWINLDEEERNDLALFLSGNTEKLRGMKEEPVDLGKSTTDFLKADDIMRKYSSYSSTSVSRYIVQDKEMVTQDVKRSIMDVNGDAEQEKESPGTSDFKSKVDGLVNSRRIRSLPDVGRLEIVIDDGCSKEKMMTPKIEDTPKAKGSKPFFWNQSCEDRLRANRGMMSYLRFWRLCWTNLQLGWVAGGQRRIRSPLMLPSTCSIRYSLILILTIFLVVPFLLYSA